MEISSIICYGDLIYQDSNYYYPLDVEAKLISCVKSGNFDEADIILKQFLMRILRYESFQ